MLMEAQFRFSSTSWPNNCAKQWKTVCCTRPV